MTDVIRASGASLPAAKSIRWNPSAEELRQLTGAMPNAHPTVFDNYNVETKVVARSKASTFVVTDHPESHSDQTISRAEGEKIAARQDAYIAGQDMLVIDGHIGNDPDHRVPARLYIEAANANIAGMQQALYFAAENAGPGFQPRLTVIYTPNLTAPGYPSDRVIAVDLVNGVTRVLNSDYFGESKKGGLRMWNALTYERGGLAMHAGCKVVPTSRGEQSMLIVGLSGTGKTTTTFTRQNGSQPVQDDFVALYPGGRIVSTENGCFAKTFALDPRDEPAIHGAVTKPEAYLENVSQDATGACDFFDTSYTQNGRAVFRMEALGIARDARRDHPRQPAAHPQPQRQPHPRGGPAQPRAGGGLLHARRDPRHQRRRQGGGGQGAPRPRDQPLLPAAPRLPGQPLPRAPRRLRLRGLPPQHRPDRRRGRRRARARR